MCAIKAHINKTSDLKFTSLRHRYKPCQITMLFTLHYQEPSNMRKLHKIVHGKKPSNCPPPKN